MAKIKGWTKGIPREVVKYTKTNPVKKITDKYMFWYLEKNPRKQVLVASKPVYSVVVNDGRLPRPWFVTVEHKKKVLSEGLSKTRAIEIARNYMRRHPNG